MSARTTVLVTSRSFSSGDWDGRAALEQAGVRILTGSPDHDLARLGPELAEVEAWIAGTGPVTAAHLDAAPLLRLVARYGVGVDAVDLEAARTHGVAVTNTPGANSAAVADHALGLLLAALRSVAQGDRRVRSGDWRVDRTREISSLCVGIVGAGRIGRGFAERLMRLGATVLAHDPWVDPVSLRAAGMEPAALWELAERCDAVSLHAPGDDVVVDAAWLAAVRRRPIVVNTARARLVDEAAMAAALTEGRVRAFAADTLATESGGSASPLLDPSLTDRTVFTPHAAAQTVEAVDAMTRGVVDAVLAWVQDVELPHVVVAPPNKTGLP
ncbi:NAD(P)-dependent oxidoreductase [Nocardioides sp. SYSU D00065]|uniref:NAD(P)-dependent oxidoreductase n=1 Tax=Nocardioides sp. SYSU D00065 TaxID=2817378 RepID=UPI001B33D66C|nr:NAD(P)-dependent oxidoreductase [Nocardioides sp. SYSU D00065]